MLAVLQVDQDEEARRRRESARVRLRQLLANMEAATKTPSQAQLELGVLYRVLGVSLVESLAGYLRDEMSVDELGAVTWAAQRLPLQEVTQAFSRVARDSQQGLPVRVKAVQVLMAVSGQSLRSFEQRLEEFGLLREEVSGVLNELARASLLALLKEIGRPETVAEAIEAILSFQEAVGDEMLPMIDRLASTLDPAAANMLAGLGVGGRTLEVRAQARRALVRLLNKEVLPNSEVLAWLAQPAYAGCFRLAHTIHVVWQFPDGLVQSAIFILRPSPSRACAPGWVLHSAHLSRPMPVDIARRLLRVMRLCEPDTLVEPIPFAQAHQLVSEGWEAAQARPAGLPHTVEVLRGFLDNWVLQANLLQATEEKPVVDLFALPSEPSQLLPEAAAVADLLEQVLVRWGWTSYQIEGAQALWTTYVDLVGPNLRLRAHQVRNWAAAVAFSCRLLRGEPATRKQVAAEFAAQPSSLSRYARKIAQRLGLGDPSGLRLPL